MLAKICKMKLVTACFSLRKLAHIQTISAPCVKTRGYPNYWHPLTMPSMKASAPIASSPFELNRNPSTIGSSWMGGTMGSKPLVRII